MTRQRTERVVGLTVRLIKEEVDSWEHVLRAPESMERYDLNASLPYSGALYIRLPKESVPRWVDFLKDGLAEGLVPIKTSSAAAILFVEAAGRRFALSFGFGHALLVRVHSKPTSV